MVPCNNCDYDSDICIYHPCNGCGAEDEECEVCEIITEGFDCNMCKEY